MTCGPRLFQTGHGMDIASPNDQVHCPLHAVGRGIAEDEIQRVDLFAMKLGGDSVFIPDQFCRRGGHGVHAFACSAVYRRPFRIGVDRIHTATHGYFKALCQEAEIEFDEDLRVDQFFKLLLEQHPAFQDLGPRGQDIKTILRSFSSILNPIRDRASVAHPNDHLLDNQEAMFVINVARALIQYVDAKLGDCTEAAK